MDDSSRQQTSFGDHPKTFDALGRYELIEPIGEGGMGRVFKAWDHQLRRAVAVKFFLEFSAENDKQRRQIEQEVRNHAALQHPNIVTIYDHGFAERGPYTVMELVDGPTLYQRIEQRRLTVKEFLTIGKQTLEGLKAAHQIGMLHRDLKAPNIMLTTSDRNQLKVKILDFGLSKKINKPEVQTADQEEGVLGSVHTMAPEQFNLDKIDERTDLYSLGCIFYYCLSGQFPFDGKTAEDIMVSHLRHRVKPLYKVSPRVPRALSDWVMRMINRKPAERFNSANTALRELLVIAHNPHLLRVEPQKKATPMTYVLWGAVAAGILLLVLAIRFLPELIAFSTPDRDRAAASAEEPAVPRLDLPDLPEEEEPVSPAIAYAAESIFPTEEMRSTPSDLSRVEYGITEEWLQPADLQNLEPGDEPPGEVTLRGAARYARKPEGSDTWVLLFDRYDPGETQVVALVPDDLYKITRYEMQRLLGNDAEYIGPVHARHGRVEIVIDSPEDIRLFE